MPRILRLGGLVPGAPQHLFIATPVTRDPTPEYVHSMMATQIACVAAGINLDWTMLVGDCHVDDARNWLVREFLESDCTDLFFIDGDQGWGGADVVKLVRQDCDVVAGVLPKKADDDQGYPVRLFPGPILTDSRGLIRIEGVGTGFMRIRRNVLETLYEKEPRKHRDSAAESQKRLIAIIFERDFDTSEALRLSGDYAFCSKWRKLGGEIWIDPSLDFAHVGEKVWTGNVGRYLCAQDNLLSPRFCSAFMRIQLGVGKSDDFIALYEEWGNQFAVLPDLAEALFSTARELSGSVFETGSGLSTLILGASGVGVYALEHDLSWVQRMESYLRQLQLKNVKVQYSPLERRGNGAWYSKFALPRDVDLVLIDGPPREWGRESIFEVLDLSNVSIIADDMQDASWRVAVENWSRSQDRTMTILGDLRKFAVISRKVARLEAAE